MGAGSPVLAWLGSPRGCMGGVRRAPEEADPLYGGTLSSAGGEGAPGGLPQACQVLHPMHHPAGRPQAPSLGSARLRGEDGTCGRMDVWEAAGECCEPCGFKLVWGHVLDLANVNDRRSVGVSLDLTCVRCDGGSSPAPHPTPAPTLTSSSHLALFCPVCCAGGIRAQVSTFDFSWAFTLICFPPIEYKPSRAECCLGPDPQGQSNIWHVVFAH